MDKKEGIQQELAQTLQLKEEQVELILSTLFKCFVWDDDYAASLLELQEELRTERHNRLAKGQDVTALTAELNESQLKFDLAEKSQQSFTNFCQQVTRISGRPFQETEIQLIFRAFKRIMDQFALLGEAEETTEGQKWSWFKRAEECKE